MLFKIARTCVLQGNDNISKMSYILRWFRSLISIVISFSLQYIHVPDE